MGDELTREQLIAKARDNGFGPVDYPDEIATIEAVRRRVDGVPTCERPNLRSLWGGCKLGSGCQCTSATQQGECEHRADRVAACPLCGANASKGRHGGGHCIAAGILIPPIGSGGATTTPGVAVAHRCPTRGIPCADVHPTNQCPQCPDGVAIPHGGRDGE